MRNKEYWVKWAKAALIRAGRTFAQGLLASLTAATFLSQVRWGEAFSAAALGATISLLMSLAGLPEVEEAEELEEVDEDAEDPR